MEIHVYNGEGLPEPFIRGRVLEGVIQNLQVLLIVAGAIALLVAAPSNRWIGYAMGGALLALEVARWAVGRRTLRRVPSFALEDYLASAPVGDTQRKVLAANMLAVIAAVPVFIAYGDLDNAVLAFGGAVVAVSLGALFRMWLHRSWLAASWVPGPRAHDKPE